MQRDNVDPDRDDSRLSKEDCMLLSGDETQGAEMEKAASGNLDPRTELPAHGMLLFILICE